MRKLFTAAFLFISLQSASGQALSSQVGEPTKEKLNGKQSSIILADKSNTLVLHQKKANSYEIHAFDPDLTFETSYELKLPKTGKTEHELIQVIGVEDKLIMLTTYFDEAEKIRSVYAWKLEVEGTFDSEFILVDEINSKEGIDPQSVSYALGKSQDGKAFFYFRKITTPQGEPTKFIYKLFGKNVAVLADKVITTKFVNKDVTVKDFVADGSDNLFLTAKVQDMNMSKRPSRVELPYYWTALHYSVSETKLYEYKLDLGPGIFVQEVTIALVKDEDKIHAAGFYGNSQRSGMSGSYITTFDIITHQMLRKTLEVFDKPFIEINRATMRKFVDTNIPRKIIRGVMDVRASLLVRPGGNVFLIGEVYRVNKEVPRGEKPDTYPNEKSKITHYIQGLLVVNFNARGSVEWQTSMAINQAPLNEEGASISFVVGMVRDKVALVYNDHPANAYVSDPMKKETMERPDTKSSATFIAYVDKYGKLDADVLWLDKEEASIVLPYSAYQLNRTQTLALAHSPKGTYRLVKLTFY